MVWRLHDLSHQKDPEAQNMSCGVVSFAAPYPHINFQAYQDELPVSGKSPYENCRCATRQSRRAPMARWIMDPDTSRRFS